jgi:DNA replication protein DnaC
MKTLSDVISKAVEVASEEPERDLGREYDEWWAREQRAAEDSRRFDREFRLRDLPITDQDIECITRGEVEPTRCTKAVDAWLARSTPILVMCGDVGRGKTFAASVAFHRHADSLYHGAREVERLFAARYGDELAEQDRCCTVQMLVVDDLGRERDADGMTAALLDLIDDRRKRGRRTVLISNLGKAALLARYNDPRLHSRLAQPGVCMWLVDSGQDMRGGA